MPDARFFFYLICPIIFYFFFFFFNDTATTEIYTLSLHDALPISGVLAVMRGTLLIVGTRILDSPSLGNSVLVNLNSAEQGRSPVRGNRQSSPRTSFLASGGDFQ